jgi:hypothetical protein
MIATIIIIVLLVKAISFFWILGVGLGTVVG